jgi:hypothetical protein
VIIPTNHSPTATESPHDPGVLRSLAPYHPDFLLSLALAVAAGIGCYFAGSLIDPLILEAHAWDSWFHSDMPRVFGDMADRWADHGRTGVHPLFPLLTWPFVQIFHRLGMVELLTAVRLVVVLVAASWIVLLFAVLRLLGLTRLDASLLALLGATSAASVFWFAVVETFLWGSLSILAALLLVALTERRSIGAFWYVAVGILTAGFTVTNWLVSVIASAVQYAWKRTVLLTLAVFGAVLVLGVLQQRVFITTVLLTDLDLSFERRYMFYPDAGGPFAILRAFFFHSTVMPAFQLSSRGQSWPVLTVQHASLGSGSAIALLAVTLWAALLALGVWAVIWLPGRRPFRLTLCFALLGQLGLHLVYGEETFLYSIQFLPLLIVLAALTMLTPLRGLARGLAGVLLICIALNNGLQLSRAAEAFNAWIPPRYQLQAEMRKRPGDFWPRSRGHVILAVPGTAQDQKAYHEPGGSLSPAPGSFGLSVWVLDRNSTVQKTSDTILLDQIQQRFRWDAGKAAPSVLTETPEYQMEWAPLRPGRWLLRLQTKSLQHLALAIRSVGPAGGPVSTLEWDGQHLVVNGRWSVQVTPKPVTAVIGEEGPVNWSVARSSDTRWRGHTGWGYARIELDDSRDWSVLVDDSWTAGVVPRPIASTSRGVNAMMPDERFATSLLAQEAHLLMSLIGNQTRPSDPLSFPYPSVGSAAYITAALSRTGHGVLAADLARFLAEHDFFGGHGAEADAPGLSLWALEEAAVRLHDPVLDLALWPDVHRKAELILAMRQAKQRVSRESLGPVLPVERDNPDLHVVAEPAQAGLIVRRGGVAPRVTDNAVSYRGLQDAASLARRLKRMDDAGRWQRAAVELKDSWQQYFQLTGPATNIADKVALGSVWVSGLGPSLPGPLLATLEAHWASTHDSHGDFRTWPAWTYHDLAEAHEWLLLGRPDRVWDTVKWFWTHQASPGLYSWWQGDNRYLAIKPDTVVLGTNDAHYAFGEWDRIRGWATPPHVTPHYWTAAEMLLLQLDMLASEELAASEPTVVIAGGLPSAWFEQPLSVKNLRLRHTTLDWTWDGRILQVKARGVLGKVRLGPHVPAHAVLRTELVS